LQVYVESFFKIYLCSVSERVEFNATADTISVTSEADTPWESDKPPIQ